MSKVTILTKPNRIVIASKGVQGAPGKDGVITPELEGLRDEAQQAAQDAAGSATIASDAAGAAVAAQGAAEDSAGQASASAALAEQARLLGATIGFATKADMDASLAHPDGTLALVTSDATASNNGTYRKTGASGSGVWVQSSDRVTGLEGRTSAVEAIADHAAESAALAVQVQYAAVDAMGQDSPVTQATSGSRTGWAYPIGPVAGFNAVEVGVAAYSSSRPATQVRIQIRQGSHTGPVVASTGVVTLDYPLTTTLVRTFDLDTVVANAAGANLWIIIESDGFIGWHLGSPLTRPASIYGRGMFQNSGDGPFTGVMSATINSDQSRDLYVRFLHRDFGFTEALHEFAEGVSNGERDSSAIIMPGTRDGEVRQLASGGRATWDAQAGAWRMFDDSLVAPDLIHESNFNAPDGTALQSYAPEVGGPWEVQEGGWEVRNNEARIAGDAPLNVALTDLGTSDFEIEWEVESTSTRFRQMFRAVDINNAWTVHYNSGVLGVNLYFDGSLISRGATAAVGGFPHRIRVRCIGPRIEAQFVNASGVVSEPLVVEHAFEHMLETKAGMRVDETSPGRTARVQAWRAEPRMPVSNRTDALASAVSLADSDPGPLSSPGLWNQWVVPLAVYLERRRRRTYWVSVGTEGQEYVSAYDHDTRQTETVVVGKVIGDDHSAGAILPPRPGTDDPLRVIYTGHSDWPYSRLVTFAGPEDITSWTTEELPWPGDATYTHIHRVGSRVWLFARAASSGLQARWSDDGGKTWSNPVGWFTNEYLLGAVAPDGRTLHFATHYHPGNETGSPIQDIVAFQMDMVSGEVKHPGTGAVLGNVLTGAGLPVSDQSGLRVYTANAGERTRLWDVSPWGDVGFQVSEDITSGIYNVARVVDGAVNVIPLGPTGTSLDAEPLTNIYMAGMCFSRAARDVVWCGREAGGQWWIDRGESIDAGASWSWQQVSDRDSRKRFRPLPVHGAWPGSGPHPEHHVLWCEGRAGAPDGGYTYYRGQYSADVAGVG